MKKLTFFAAILMCCSLALSCSKKGSQNKAETLYLFTWTYYTPEDALRQFEKEYGCTVKVDTYDSNEVMYAKLKAAGSSGYDIAFPSQDYASIMMSQGMLRKIDMNRFENSKYINPDVLAKITYDPTMEYCVPYYMGAAGIAVNKQRLSNYERSWNIFADPRIKGHASMMDDMREVMGDALVSLGSSVNTVNDTELKNATDLIIKKWKPNLVKFDAEGFGKSFAAGDFWVCQGYAEVIYGEVPEDKQDAMIDFFIPKEGGPMYIDSMVILRDSKHYDLAMKFINFIHRPEVYAQFLDFFRFPASVNLEASSHMKTKPLYKASEMENCELKLDLADGLDKYNELWQEIRFTD
ncbi:MAG: extracellular solute-binding protein [Treponema sp.]|nr:extracellular solute-binding protein [Treponema sp.]